MAAGEAGGLPVSRLRQPPTKPWRSQPSGPSASPVAECTYSMESPSPAPHPTTARSGLAPGYGHDILGVQAGELRQEKTAALSDGLLGGGCCQMPLERQDLLLLPLGGLQLPIYHLRPGLLVRQGARWV